jgi:PTS system nitrogen regulatory IIA component
MDLKKIIQEENCLILKESKKTEVLIEMIKAIMQTGRAEDEENLKKEIFYREQLMSTGIGMGIGVPHIRFKGVTEPVAAVGIYPKGIDDYDSIDDEEVTIVIMILVGENQHRQHIRLLSQIMEKLKDKKLRERLLQSQSSEEIYNIMTGEDNE